MTEAQQEIMISSQNLDQDLIDISKTFPGLIGLYFHDLNTNKKIEINADEKFPMASTFKIPVLIQLYRDRDAGLLSLTEQVTLISDNKQTGHGLLKYFAVGTSLTLQDLALMMIAISDNKATDIIIDKVQLSRINHTLEKYYIKPMTLHRSIGELLNDFSKMTQEEKMNDERDTTTPRAMGILLEKLLQGELASKQSTEDIKFILHQQLLNARIPRNISTRGGLKIAHKTGTTSVAINDVGFIEFPHRREIILCIYTKKDPAIATTYQAEQMIGHLAQRVVESASN